MPKHMKITNELINEINNPNKNHKAQNKNKLSSKKIQNNKHMLNKVQKPKLHY